MPSTRQPRRKSSSARRTRLSVGDAKDVHDLQQDFDRQYHKLMVDFDKNNEAFVASLTASCKMELLKIPKKRREKTMGFALVDSDLVAAPATGEDGFKHAMDAVAEDVKSQVTKGLQSTSRRGNAAEKKTKANMPPPSTGLRKSSRQRTSASDAQKTPIAGASKPSIPVFHSASFVRGKPNVYLTPLSTSASGTPFSRSVARREIPGERLHLCSDNGSPIVNGTYTAAKKGSRGGRRMQKATMDENSHDALDLDDKEKEKLLKVRSMMDCLLKDKM